jgi:hypothetical protein
VRKLNGTNRWERRKKEKHNIDHQTRKNITKKKKMRRLKKPKNKIKNEVGLELEFRSFYNHLNLGLEATTTSKTLFVFSFVKLKL